MKALNPNARGTASDFLNEEKRLEDEEQAVEQPEDVGQAPSVVDLFAQRYGHIIPLAQIEKWKQEFGDGNVIVYAPDDREVYIYRPLRRFERRTIRRELEELSSGQAAQEDSSLLDTTLQDRVMSYCLLYPRADADFKRFSPFGLIETLYKLVMEASHSIPIERAIQNTVRL